MPKEQQLAWYEGADGQLHTRPAKGDRLIKPKENGRGKRREKSDPFAEVLCFERALQRYQDGEGVYQVLTGDGRWVSITITNGTIQASGQYDPDDVCQVLVVSQPDKPLFSSLSDSAKRLYWKRRSDERKSADRAQPETENPQSDLDVNDRETRLSPAEAEANYQRFLQQHLDIKAASASVYPGRFEEDVNWENVRRLVKIGREKIGRR